jgi:alpha-tubulin suppressor-like RCC1 family protein
LRPLCWGFSRSEPAARRPPRRPSSAPRPCTLRGPIEGSAEFVGGDLGDDHGCLIRADGKIYCWGNNDYGQLGVAPSTTPTVATLSAASPLASSIFPMAIAVGAKHSCAVDTNGKAFCWGSNAYGQLGVGSAMTTSHPSPVQFFAGLGRMRSVAAGAHFTSALLVDGTVFCAGENTHGQLGNGTTTFNPSPVQVRLTTPQPLLEVVQIAAGDHHACALLRDGTVRCWGAAVSAGGASDLLLATLVGGLPAAAPPTTQANQGAVGPFVRSIAAGGDFTCAVLTDGTARCWGQNGYGQLGNGATGFTATAVPVSSLTDAVSIGAGVQHACAVTAGGAMQCWGRDTSGQAGNGAASSANVLTPVTVAYGTAANRTLAVMGGWQHSCAFSQEGLFCWGDDGFGQLGNGGATTATQHTPVPVTMPPNSNWVGNFPNGYQEYTPSTFQRGRVLDVGENHACMLVAAGAHVADGTVATGAPGSSSARSETRVACWGDNQYGQLGTGNTTPQHRPRFVSGALPGAALTVSSGDHFTCALMANGTVWCWGRNTYGQTSSRTGRPTTIPSRSGRGRRCGPWAAAPTRPSAASRPSPRARRTPARWRRADRATAGGPTTTGRSRTRPADRSTSRMRRAAAGPRCSA